LAAPNLLPGLTGEENFKLNEKNGGEQTCEDFLDFIHAHIRHCDSHMCKINASNVR